EKALSVAFPQDAVVSSDGSTLYVVAQGSGKLAIYDTAALEAGNVYPDAADQVALSGGGPAGVALDECGHRAFVLTRFDNSISVIDLRNRTEVKKLGMYNPEPTSVTAGRRFLYDANYTSEHGDTACASCHIGGDKDELSWDLGNPGGGPLPITQSGDVFAIPPAAIIGLLPYTAPVFQYNMPVKGPMTTQSLRGMDNHGSMHWRGDRNGAVQQSGAPFIDPDTGAPFVSAQPDDGIYDEFRAFTSFNVAFPGLIGRDSQIDDDEMADFATFVLQMSYPPNPVRNLDNSLTAAQQHGHDFYFNHLTISGVTRELPSDRFHNCNGCHTLDPAGNTGATDHPGFFGTSGRLTFEFESQIFKVPHLRNQYTKVGMFGRSPDTLQPGTVILQQGPATDQVRGFGFNHEGGLGQLEHFFTGQVFLKATSNVTLPGGIVAPPNPFGIPFVDFQALINGQVVFIEDGGFTLRHDIVAFMMAFDSNQAPVVGQQITLTSSNALAAAARIDLLRARADAGECDLVAKAGRDRGGRVTGYLYTGGSWLSDRTSRTPLSDGALRNLVGDGGSVTYTCVPRGSGPRIGIDRDGDGWADGDEDDLGTNPADALSHP
ncbi:MAG TPA: hypothetical protein VL172_08670, partial [Kofleriaceae bacterium]|nr:hypothetical protein [Kofleriaceae bacterium]